MIFLSQTTLLRCLTLLLWSLTMTRLVLLLWISFFLATLVVVLHWLSIHWKNLIMLLSQFPRTFLQTQKTIPRFIAQLITILLLIGTVYLKAVSWKDFLLLLYYWILWVGPGWNWWIYIPYSKCQVNFHSFPWFSATFAAAISLRNDFFYLYQENKSVTSKVEFGQVSNRSKSVFKRVGFNWPVK